MDPGTIIAVITTATVILRTFVSCCRDVKGARGEKAQLQAEALGLVSLLVSLEEDAKAADSAALGTLSTCFENIKQPLELLKTLIGDLTQKLHLEPKSSFHQVVDAAKWPLVKKDVAEALKIMERVKLLIVLALDRDLVFLQRESLKLIQDLHKDVRALQSTAQSDEKLKLAAWLSPLNFKARQSQHLQALVPSTCEWILDTDEVKVWLQGSKKILLCYGPGGVGKTALSSFLIHHIEDSTRDDDAIVLYAFCASNDAQKRSLGDLTGGLLRQALWLTKAAETSCQNLHKAHHNDDSTASQEELFSTLQSILSGFKKIYIIVDALDELDVDPTLYYTFLETAKTLSSSAQILFTSRTIETLRDQFNDAVELNIVDMPSVQLHTYVTHRLHNDAALSRIIGRDHKFQAEITDLLVEKSKGLVLAAALYLSSFTGCINKKQLRENLTGLPTGLAQIYDGLAKSMCSSDSPAAGLASRALLWAVFARRPLSTEEMVSAVAIELGMKEVDPEALAPIETIISVSKGLLVVDNDREVVVFAHQTANEHFTEHCTTLWPSGHAEIARACLSYLNIDTFEHSPVEDYDEMAIRKLDYPLLEYACFNWAYHAREAQELGLEKQILALLSQPCKLDNIIQFGPCFMDSDFPRNTDGLRSLPIHLAAFSGLKKTCAELLKTGADPLATGPGEVTAFRLAVHQGHQNVLRLMHSRVPRDTISEELSVAADEGLAVSVELLIHMGAYLEHTDLHRRTPLLLAIRAANPHLARLLINYRADATAKDNSGDTALHYAARKGLLELIDPLLEAGCKIDVLNKHRISPFLKACLHNQRPAAIVLLNRGAAIMPSLPAKPKLVSASAGKRPRRPLSPDGKADEATGLTALHMAAYGGNPEILEMLADKFLADLDTRDVQAQTPLMYAASAAMHNRLKQPQDWVACIRILADKGASLNGRDSNGNTALHLAAGNANGFFQLQTLLQHGADPNATNWQGQTPLHVCSARRRLPMIQELLRHKADVTTEDISGYMPIMAAMKGIKPEAKARSSANSCISLLEQHHGGKDPFSITQLRILYALAVQYGDEKILRMFYRKQDWENLMDFPAICYACGTGNLSAVKYLLETDSEVTELDQNGNSCLTYAVAANDSVISTFLIEQRPELAQYQDESRRNVLDIALLTASPAIIQMIGGFENKVFERAAYDSAHSNVSYISRMLPRDSTAHNLEWRYLGAAQSILKFCQNEHVPQQRQARVSPKTSAPPSEVRTGGSKNSTDFGVGISERSSELDKRFGGDHQYTDVEQIFSSRASNRSGSSVGSGDERGDEPHRRSSLGDLRMLKEAIDRLPDQKPAEDHPPETPSDFPEARRPLSWRSESPTNEWQEVPRPAPRTDRRRFDPDEDELWWS